jgi:RNA polymerase sigma-70 factor (ECF subfamily)
VNTREQHTRFGEWLKEHGAMLHHVANGFADGADRHDLVQELLLAVWRAIPAFRGGSQPSTFIYRVAHNAALTWKRSVSNYRRRVTRFEEFTMLDPARDDGRSERDRELLELLYAQIRQLPAIDRSLILLHLDGVNYADMAMIHGLTESNVGARLTRLKQKLSAAMKEVTLELR